MANIQACRQTAAGGDPAYQIAESLPMPLASFDDHELDVLLRLAGPIPPEHRDDFLKTIAAELACLPEQQRGDGVLYRAAREVQRRFIRAPSITGTGTRSKYR
jgi:hypothetical protein